MVLSLLQPLFFYLLLPLFISVVFIHSKWFSSAAKRRTHNNHPPPSPGKLPIIGNLHQLGSSPHRSLQALAQKHGALMLLHFGSVPVIVASTADAAREIMKTHDLIFSNRPKLSIASRLSYESKDIAFAPYGEYWRQLKSIAVLQLLSNKRVQSFRHVREEETALMIEKIRMQSSFSSSLVNLSEMSISLTNDVVCRIALGRKYGGRKFKDLLERFVELLGVFSVGDYLPWLSWVTRLNGLDARIVKVAEEFDEFLEGTIEEHLINRKSGETTFGEGLDFVDILLEIQRENRTKTDFTFHRDTIKALILDMFAAGTDTTFTILEWTFTEVLRHPKVLKNLQNEVREIVRGKSNITEDDLGKLHYLKAVIKETLRFHTPIPLLVPREPTHDIKVMDYDIAAGIRVFINAWAIGRDPSFVGRTRGI